jgi:hypothetical protein
MATAAVNRDFIEAVAGELALGIESAVEHWLSKIESVFENPRLTTLGRLQTIQDIVADYKRLAGKVRLDNTQLASQSLAAPRKTASGSASRAY